MKMRERFVAAKNISEDRLEAYGYRWIPKTTIGWIVRIACTDVGQIAWNQAKTNSGNTTADQHQLTQESAAHQSSEKDSLPA